MCSPIYVKRCIFKPLFPTQRDNIFPVSNVSSSVRMAHYKSSKLHLGEGETNFHSQWFRHFSFPFAIVVSDSRLERTGPPPPPTQ
jgi:hypothetical protein